MNPEARVPKKFVENPRKAQHMAILENQMRIEAAVFEEEAVIYREDFEETGDPLYKRAATGKRIHAKKYRSTISGAVDEVGETYDVMSGVINSMSMHLNGYVGEHAKKHREKLEERLELLMGRYGLIGTDTEVYKHTAYEFLNDPNIPVARAHAEEMQRGFKRTRNYKQSADPLKYTA